MTFLLFCTLLIVSCGAQKKIIISNKSELFKQGVFDGCSTAEGNYSKNHYRFNNNAEYHEGWFHGRQYCEYYKRSDIVN